MDKKGFVLAEAIVVGVAVLGLFSYIAMNILPLVTSYDKSINYDNLQEVYLINTLKDELIYRNFDFKEDVYKVTKEKNSYIVRNSKGEDLTSSIGDFLYNYLKVSEIYIFKTNKNKNPMNNNNISRSMKEYSNYYYIKNIKERDVSKKVMLVKFRDNSFGSIEVS